MVLILDNSRCLTETQHQTSSVHRQPQSDDGPDKKKKRPIHQLHTVKLPLLCTFTRMITNHEKFEFHQIVMKGLLRTLN